MRFNRRLVLAILLVALGTRVEAQNPETSGTVRGRVVRAGTTEGLGKAVVELVPAGMGTLSDFDYSLPAFEFFKTRNRTKPATSNEKGEFVFENVPAGLYRMESRRDRFTYTPHGAVVDIQPGAPIQNVTIAMAPAAAITGIVVDENDKPVPYAAVTALDVAYGPGGRRASHVVAVVETNDLGEYRLHSLAPGEYLISVDTGESANREQRIRQNIPQQPKAYPVHYYPGTTEIGAAKSVRVRESGLDITGIDLRLRQTSMATIRGKILMPAAGTTPLPMPALMLTPVSFPDASPGFGYRPNSEGEFEIPNVPPGSYLLKAWTITGRNGPSVHSPMLRVEMGNRDIGGLAVPVVIGPTVAGEFRVDGINGPLPFETTGVLVKFVGRVGGVNGLYGGDAFNGITEANGRYSSAQGAGAFPGVFDVVLRGLPPGYYLKAPLTLEIPSADIPPSIALNLTLGRHEGTASGTVTGADGRPYAGAMVVLVPGESLRTRADRYLRASTDANGRYRIASPPPGDYTAYAFEGVEGDAYYNPDFLQKYLGRGARISITENALASADLRLIPMERQ